MPKKFSSENTKAVAARERKKNAKEENHAKKERELEEAKWKDDDKHIQKKQQKKEAEERKRQEQLQRKAEAKALLEEELGSIKATKAPAPAPKITRAQINMKKETETVKLEGPKKIETHLDTPLIENVNRLEIDGEEARTVDEAITLLSGAKLDDDKHPEKRMKALYNAFEKKRLEELKTEEPSLRLSQLKQIIFKEWQKSPSNPLNKE